MSRIKLLKLILKNFKGVKELSVNFSDLTNIKGDNGTGKTSIYDAFNWLLFDKDSADRQSFEIKTLDSENRALHGLEHEVTGILWVDDRDIKLTKIFKEKWTKKKGEAERQFTGHETLYYVNEVPVKLAEYKETIAKFLQEQLFKLISNPLYFSTSMKWQDRRNVIMEIIGDIPPERLYEFKPELSALAVLMKDNDLETFRRSLAARKRKLNEEIKSIPYRIDELNNSLQEFDFEALAIESRQYETELKTIEERLLDSSRVSESLLGEKKRLYELKSKLYDLKHKAESEARKQSRDLENRCSALEHEIMGIKRNVEEQSLQKDNLLRQCKELSAANEELRASWYEINDRKLSFEEVDFVCPTCGRAFEEQDTEARKQQMTENFYIDKTNNLRKVSLELNSNKVRGEEYREKIKRLEGHMELLGEKLNARETERLAVVQELEVFTNIINRKDNPEIASLEEAIEELEKRLSNPSEVDEEAGVLNSKRSELNQKLDECRKKLLALEGNEKVRARIKELLEEEKQLSRQIAELESQEFLCEEYIKAKVELLEASINRKFKFVKFKLFNTLINGSVEDCCEALINGVPFSNANTAGQINAGLDIINALCSHYGVEAPVFIDNRESVNRIIECNSQIINLIVSRDKTLVVENL